MTKSSRSGMGQASDVWSLAAGDFDQDGDLDLAVAQNYSYDDNISVLLGKGDGSFEREPLRHTLVGRLPPWPPEISTGMATWTWSWGTEGSCTTPNMATPRGERP